MGEWDWWKQMFGGRVGWNKRLAGGLLGTNVCSVQSGGGSRVVQEREHVAETLWLDSRGRRKWNVTIVIGRGLW